MPELLQIDEPARPPAVRPDLKAFLSLGFRPLYIAGCLWALVSIAIWIFAPQLIPAPLAGVAWHAHEMLWGFIATIAVAFLLTASATWTGFNPIKGWPLAVLTLLWVIARIGYLTGGPVAVQAACISETAFFLASAIALLRVMLKGKSVRNYGLPWLVLGLGVANILYMRAALQGNYIELMRRFDLGLICMAIIALLIARRVIPFFAMRAVAGLKIPMQTRSGHVQLVLGVAAIVLGLAGLAAYAAAALAIVGLIGLIQVVTWKPAAVQSKPILWILYVGYTLMSLGLVFAAAHIAGLSPDLFGRAAVHVHIIAMGGFSVLIIGMVTRTALGHLGRPLALDRSMLAAYGLVLLAFVLRLAALWPSALSVHFLHLAATAWILAFALYLWRFVPMLIRPRPDAVKPQAPAGRPSANQASANQISITAVSRKKPQ
ncbi:MAG TPA: NnrS family protein [Eoetvoesiella sp.]|uniref:NnrS family protein n=1 Tax=Eoetvoesiella sp. TaxID=1966355 RepID=UPI002B808464|nr:NnrS family protein [Eoetvoesiella sp.]HWK60902.1 NnrS family protein [Eoetvoesiella sp.]